MLDRQTPPQKGSRNLIDSWGWEAVFERTCLISDFPWGLLEVERILLVGS